MMNICLRLVMMVLMSTAFIMGKTAIAMPAAKMAIHEINVQTLHPSEGYEDEGQLPSRWDMFPVPSYRKWKAPHFSPSHKKKGSVTF
jgi:hypothetical protein